MHLVYLSDKPGYPCKPWVSSRNCGIDTQETYIAGIQIEEPFSVLPLDKIAHRLRLDLLEMMEHMKGEPWFRPVLEFLIAC